MTKIHPNQRLCRSSFFSIVASLILGSFSKSQDLLIFGKLANFVRWAGVALSVPRYNWRYDILIRIVGNLANRLSRRFANRRPTIQKIESAARFAVFTATAAICISLSVRLDSTALTVIGGALAFAVGFACETLFAAFIAGITIMFDRPFQVGDRVAYAGEYGDIIKIDLGAFK
jgi:small-conductance mechanosensitive channel